jgi:hypothetical protein
MRTCTFRPTKLILLISLLAISCALPSVCGIGEQITEQLPASPPKVELGEEYMSEAGGYAFKTIPGYQVEEFYGLVTMLAPDADPEIGPGITMLGGTNDEAKTADQLLQDFQGGLEAGSSITHQREVTVGGIKGIMVDVETSRNNKEAFGRIVIVAVTPNQMFSLLGVYPDKNWEGEHGDNFDAVLTSVRFFEPVESDIEAMPEEEASPEAPPKEPPQAEGGILRQWASSAKASSEYGSDDWSALQATGKPNTPECGDYETAWASLGDFSVEWLEVAYDVPVTPSEINIYETHTPTQVVKVELLDTAGKYHEVYTGTPKITDCPYILKVPVKGANYQAVAVKITVDQSKLEMPWDEIDAVELVGLSGGAAPTEGQKPPQPPAPGDVSDQPPTLPTSNPDQEASYKLSYTNKYEGEEEGTNIEVSVHPDRIDIRFKGEFGRYLLLTLPPDIGDNFSADLVPFALEGRVPSSAGYYLRSIWYFGTDNGTVKTHFNSDGTLSGEADFEARRPSGETLDIVIVFEHVPLD